MATKFSMLVIVESTSSLKVIYQNLLKVKKFKAKIGRIKFMWSKVLRMALKDSTMEDDCFIEKFQFPEKS